MCESAVQQVRPRDLLSRRHLHEVSPLGRCFARGSRRHRPAVATPSAPAWPAPATARPRVLPMWRTSASRPVPVHHALRVPCRAAHCSCLTRSVSTALPVLQPLLQSHCCSLICCRPTASVPPLQSQCRCPARCSPASRGAAVPHCCRLVQCRSPLRRSLSTGSRAPPSSGPLDSGFARLDTVRLKSR